MSEMESESIMREVNIAEDDFETAAQLHAYLAGQLGFPVYYGGNLDALGDCLGDVSENTRVIVQKTASPHGDRFERFRRVLVRSADENPYLEVIVDESSDHLQGTLD